ncbi:MAG: hypothetical protein RL120_13820 [Gammaproteobacteria bacterium]
MSKKSRKQAQQGTIALCVTAGLILGIGFGAILGNVLVTAVLGMILGTAAGYYFARGHSRQHHK